MNKIWQNEEVYQIRGQELSGLVCESKTHPFFIKVFLQRRSKNKIVKIKNELGQWVEGEGDIMRAFREYYKGLAAKSSDGVEEALAMVRKVVTEKMQNMLDRTAKAGEVERTVFQLGASKVLTPNGYN